MQFYLLLFSLSLLEHPYLLVGTRVTFKEVVFIICISISKLYIVKT